MWAHCLTPPEEHGVLISLIHKESHRQSLLFVIVN